MITIETPPITPKPEEAKAQNNPEHEAELKILREKVAEQEKTISQLPKLKTNEELIKSAADSEGNVHEFLIRYLIGAEELPNELTIGTLNLRRTYLGDGWYKIMP
jgi:hypothetical protein